MALRRQLFFYTSHQPYPCLLTNAVDRPCCNFSARSDTLIQYLQAKHSAQESASAPWHHHAAIKITRDPGWACRNSPQSLWNTMHFLVPHGADKISLLECRAVKFIDELATGKMPYCLHLRPDKGFLHRGLK